MLDDAFTEGLGELGAITSLHVADCTQVLQPGKGLQPSAATKSRTRHSRLQLRSVPAFHT
jgi:hypothetical protein